MRRFLENCTTCIRIGDDTTKCWVYKAENFKQDNEIYLRTNYVYAIFCLFPLKDAGKSIWSEWSQFSPCDKDCWKFRQRFCADPNHGKCTGADKFGVQTEKVKCAEDATECYGR